MTWQASRQNLLTKADKLKFDKSILNGKISMTYILKNQSPACIRTPDLKVQRRYAKFEGARKILRLNNKASGKFAKVIYRRKTLITD